MSKNDRSWIPDAVDLDWIESLAPPLPPALAAIEAAAEPTRHPDRRSRHRPGAAGPRRRPAADRRGRHGLRLLDAVDGPRPAGRRHDRDHRSGPRADRPRARLVAPGGHRRRADHGRQRAGARRASRSDPALAGPFDLVFIDALKPEYEAYLAALTGRLLPGALVAADNVLWSGRVSGDAAGRGRRREHRGAARVRRGGAGRSALHAPRSCRSATACSSPRGAADRAADVDPGPGPPVRDPARAGRHARGPARARRRGRRRGRLGGAGRAPPGPGARPRVAPLRAQRRLRRPDDDARRRRRGGDDPAGLRGERRGGWTRRQPGSSSSARRRSRPPILAELADALAVPEDGAVVGFLGRTRSTPGTPAPGQEAEAARHAGRTRRLARVRGARLAGAADPGRRSPTRSRRASGSIAWRSSIGSARCRSASRRSRSWPSRRTGTRPSTRPATRSTRRRRAPRSGRPSGSPTAMSGSATRREPDRRRA